MADEDNFDIDIYGDEPGQDGLNGENGNDDPSYNNAQEADTGHGAEKQYADHNGQDATMTDTSNSKAMTENAVLSGTVKSDPAPLQGTKRKEIDDRPVDPNSTIAVQITELHWWITEDDLRGWCVGAGVEDEVRDITFNEHKVNGKSKGQVYIELESQAAATALKNHIDSIEPTRKQEPKTAVASFFHGPNNPYKTLPKDNARRNEPRTGGSERSFSGQNNNYQGGNPGFNSGGSFRGRGNYQGGNRGGGGMGFNRGGGFQGNAMPQMGGGPMVGANMGMNSYGGMNGGGFQNFNRGGGMMGGGMRGGMPNRGRGGMGGPGPNMMGGPMGGMNMGGMPMNGMPMGGMNMGMPGGFQNPTHFNPQFFQGQQHANGGDWGNPHGAKRPRPNE